MPDRLVSIKGRERPHQGRKVLVHLAAGIGDIVFATPLLIALDRMGFVVDLWLSADYSETDSLFRDWSVIRNIYGHDRRGIDFNSYDVLIPAVPPFYWPKFRRYYWARNRTISRPPDSLYYENQRRFYLQFARTLGYERDEPSSYRLPITSSSMDSLSQQTVALLPGCKSGEMATKRWPYFTELACRLENVAVFGTPDDLVLSSGRHLEFPKHADICAGQLSLRETAAAIAGVGLVVGNDSGLSHVSAAVGTPTIMIFGPTPDACFEPLPRHVEVLRSGLECQPCWFERRFEACSRSVRCLGEISVEAVLATIVAVRGERVLRSYSADDGPRTAQVAQ